MNRWLALLIAIPGGAMLAAFTTLAAVVLLVLAMFLLGDFSWPAWFSSVGLILVFILVLLLWFGATFIIWKKLKEI